MKAFIAFFMGKNLVVLAPNKLIISACLPFLSQCLLKNFGETPVISNLTLSLSNYKKSKLLNFKGVRFEDSGL